MTPDPDDLEDQLQPQLSPGTESDTSEAEHIEEEGDPLGANFA